MRQRSSPCSEMKTEEEVDQAIAPSRGRPTSKLKVLGRSHAMREEQSPPREPAPEENAALGHLQSPPTVVLSPSPVDEEDAEEASGHESPSREQCSLSSRCLPSHCDVTGYCERLHPIETDSPPTPKHLNGKTCAATEPGKCPAQVSKKFCDCQHQNCIKCLKDRGGNNNNHSNMNHNVLNSPNMLYVNKNRGKLRQQSSSQTSLSFESSSGNSPCLSRDSSTDYYTDTTGVDLEQFIPDTINRCAKDRALMLRIEEELLNLLNDKFQSHYKFPPMSSYHRMLVHRCAAYFGMDHNIDQLGKCIIVNKTKNTRLPEVRFKEHIKEMFNDEPPRRSILKRDSNSIEDYFKSTDSGYGLEGRRSKSFEEREEEYEKAKRRIFRGEMHDSSEDLGWSDMQWSSTESDYSRYRLQPPPEVQSRHLRKLLKVQSEESEQSMRPCVAKSYSFGGYGGGVSILTRGDSVISTHSAPGPRLLTKQDSGTSTMSWRLSPSSSGYKSQSQLSESVTPSPTSTPHPPDGDDHQLNKSAGNPVVWAVTDLSNVPKGSIIINPESGKPYKNEDGSIYYYDPVKPAPAGLLLEEPAKLGRPPTPHVDKTPMPSPKHEKCSPLKQQHSKTKSSFTNSATSPSLPFSPPPNSSVLPPSRNYQYLQVVPCENVPNLSQQPFGEFAANHPPEGNVPVYPPPYIVYTASPYGVPVQQQFDSRLGLSSMTEISTTYFVPEGGGPAVPPPINYQTQPAGTFWSQPPLSFYPNAPPQPNQSSGQRFAMQVPAQEQTAFAPAAFPATVNYVAAQQAPSQPQSAEMVPIYSNQPVQVVYPPNQPNAGVLYQNQPSFVYTPNPSMYQPSAGYSAQGMVGYPHGDATPNSGASTTPYESNTVNGFVQITQNMQQMNLGTSALSSSRAFVPVNSKYPQTFDPRRGSIPKQLNKRPVLIGSSHSSTGTSSPATTVVASGYCPAAPAAPLSGQYHTPPPSTPPTPQYMFNSPPYHAIAPRLFRQMSGDRGPTPATSKSSRSPTPATEVSQFERQRFTYPPNVYHGIPMPYLVQSDPRLVGRGQPNVYRQATPPMTQNRPLILQAPDNRSHSTKSRRPKSQRAGGLPPSGKQ